MQNAMLVRIVNRLRYSLNVYYQLLQIRISHSTVGDELVQALPFYVIHREVLLAVMLAYLVNGHDIRMLQAGRCFRLRPKPLHEIVTRKLAKEQHLNRDDAVQTHLARPIDNAHATDGDFLQQLVVAEIINRGIYD